MTNEWRTESSASALAGSVVYRCHACAADIQPDEVVFADEDGIVDPDHMTRTTRAYHPEHVPVQET